MAYMLFVAEPRGQRADRTEEEGKAVYQRMLDYAMNSNRAACCARIPRCATTPKASACKSAAANAVCVMARSPKPAK